MAGETEVCCHWLRLTSSLTSLEEGLLVKCSINGLSINNKSRKRTM